MPSALKRPADLEPICHIYTPIGMLGYGFEEYELHQTVSRLVATSVPTALVVDSGSTDSGPRKLASGSMTCPRSSYKRDLRRLLDAVTKYKVPLLIGSAGGAGTDEHVVEITRIIEELSKENAYSLKALQIFSAVPKGLATSRLLDGRVIGCGSAVPTLTQADIDESSVIVAQMGPEPYYAAMEVCPDFDVIIGGRSYDPAPYVAFATSCLRQHQAFGGQSKYDMGKIDGGIMHMGKILECGGLCATPKSAGALATVYADGTFDVSPSAKGVRCTALSVAAHTLYEKSRPDVLHGPGGHLDLTRSKYEQLPDGRTVRVTGSVFIPSAAQGLPYQVKLEGARFKGFRAMYMGSHRDPILIGQIDNQMRRIKAAVAAHVEGLDGTEWDLDWHIYGRENGHAGALPREVFVVGEARAETQELATSIAGMARIASIHASYPGQKATSGNMAFGIGGTTEIPLGPCAEFCLYHLMELEPGEEISLFPVHRVDIDFALTESAPKRVRFTRPLMNGRKHSENLFSGGARQLNNGFHTNDINLKEPKILGDVAKVLRSKNAGPYEITLDVVFERTDVYDVMKSSGLLTAKAIAGLYNIQPEQVVWSGFFDQALAFKATIPRGRASGGYFESDVHGAQMYMPLMELSVPRGLQKRLRELV